MMAWKRCVLGPEHEEGRRGCGWGGGCWWSLLGLAGMPLLECEDGRQHHHQANSDV